MRLIDADAFKNYIRDACEDMKHLFKDNGAVAKMITESFCKDIDEQPTIQPEQRWIPVTEPPKGDFMPYYATCRSKVDGRENWVIEGMYTKYSGWEYPPMVRDDRAEIIAWMPKELPEPYKGVTE